VRAALALVFGLLVAGIVAELGARLLESAAPGGLVARIGERIDDPVLDYRTAPGSGENDASSGMISRPCFGSSRSRMMCGRNRLTT